MYVNINNVFFLLAAIHNRQQLAYIGRTLLMQQEEQSTRTMYINDAEDSDAVLLVTCTYYTHTKKVPFP